MYTDLGFNIVSLSSDNETLKHKFALTSKGLRMKGVVIAIIFFLLGFMLANIPITAETRLATTDVQAESIQRIPFEAIKVYSNRIVIEEPDIQYAKVRTDSMAPLITHDSTVFEKKPTRDEILAGDVISFYEPGSDAIILHMVVDIIQKDGKTYYKTKGTANEKEDDWLVPFENVKGVMVGTFK